MDMFGWRCWIGLQRPPAAAALRQNGFRRKSPVPSFCRRFEESGSEALVALDCARAHRARLGTGMEADGLMCNVDGVIDC
jgi:hypothetical protein